MRTYASQKSNETVLNAIQPVTVSISEIEIDVLGVDIRRWDSHIASLADADT